MSEHIEMSFRGPRVLSAHRRHNFGVYAGPQTNFEGHANKIVAKLEEDGALMEDTPVSEQLRKEALRDLPQCLTMKRCVKEKLTKSVSLKSKRRPIGFWKRFKYKSSIRFKKFVANVKNFNYFELWHGSLKDIEGRFGSGYASYFKFLRWLFVMNFFVALFSFPLLVVPQIIYDATENNNSNIRQFQASDIFIGNGFFDDTVLYYGHYTNHTIQLISFLLFDVPVAYFTLIVVLYLISFVILAVSVAQSYRRTFIETKGGLQNVFANRIFCGWDYSIATKEAAHLKSLAIFNELKELLNEERRYDEDRTCIYKFWTCSTQIVANILILVIIFGVGWLTWVLLDNYGQEDNAKVLITTIVINVILMVLPSVFHYVATYEDYANPRTALYITLIRTYLLGSVIIGTVLSFWLINSGNTDCWENHLGAEIYRFVLFDFIFSVVLTTVIDSAYFGTLFFLGRDPKTEFNVAKHTLQIIFNQALFWVGFLYSPILPVIVALKMFIIWYVREGCVRKFCKPPARIWRAAQTQTWFMMMVFVGILLVIAAHGYTLKSVPPSSCGPFNGYNYTYEIVTNNIEYLEEEAAVWKVLFNVTKPGGVALFMVALGIWVYYVKEQALAQREKVKTMREMLIWMAKDKKFLVQWYNDVTKGEIGTNLRDDRFMDPRKVLPHECDDDISIVSDAELNNRFKSFS
ncbi:transmembrane channel-like protein 7 isoform X1 [Tribolium castaneum]|uniref:transmembrane channel-like protein 7 isoform X1 n=1 Tax=Tribolium castaneum TaxID=7070 RepID=UPI00046C30D0|nr:PREDICTED: transmembrane channel-like protein 7 isoform X1 [Tribolium castaneum]|eukprot:XP_008196552.1 PREDICTED: transmembrane channel-like protein 7 isoform X1 [Tribolium castaneum]